MAKLWQKGRSVTNSVIEKYTAGTDYLLDLSLMPYDIEASRAHARGLRKIGVLTSAELKSLEEGLAVLSEQVSHGTVVIRPEDEDCHTVIEQFLVTRCGDAGKKIHTGRSRNDQVLTAVRLYLRDHGKQILATAKLLAKDCLVLAEKYAQVPMPGYSHTQQAMLTSAGHYFAAYAESLIDDAMFLKIVTSHLNKNPLGSAAGFGVSIPLDRAFTTKELSFESIQINSLYCHNSRGKFESAYLEALSQIMMTLGKMATDCILFTSQEFNFFTLGDVVVTGSSIMPQKRNPDPLEIVRGNVHVVTANQMLVKDIHKSLMSGYHRDGQLIKKPVLESTEIVEASIAVMRIVLENLTINEDSITAKISSGIFTADIANALVQEQGIPFRDAYVKAAVMGTTEVDLLANIAQKKTLGASCNLGLAELKRRQKYL